MTYATGAAEDYTSCDRRRSRGLSPQTVCGALALAFSVGVAACILDLRPAAEPDVAMALPPQAPAPKPVVASNRYGALIDPALSLDYVPRPLAGSAPLDATFVAAAPPPDAVAPAPAVASLSSPVAAPAVAPAPVAEQDIPLPPQEAEPAVAQLLATVPLPTPRPPEFGSAVSPSPGPGPFRAAGRQMAQRTRVAASAAAPADNRSFFEKIFGLSQPSGPLLAYAAPEDGAFGGAQRLTSSPPVSYDRQTAIYDIAAHTVFMPNGERLEAHSGLGDRLDDPRHVSDRNRGATPPHVYELEPRAQLFHGVQALRLNPVGGGGIFGRTGLLAHTYMLGPNGDSNGCVSFRNYNAFLQAYRNGEVRRLVVVARQM